LDLSDPVPMPRLPRLRQAGSRKEPVLLLSLLSCAPAGAVPVQVRVRVTSTRVVEDRAA